jgi:DNA-binding transcriptional ArsR family regulator
MPSVTHFDPVNSNAVDQARAAVVSAGESERLGRLFRLLSDPRRVRMLFALVSVDELCVGDVAMTLDVTMDQASYG